MSSLPTSSFVAPNTMSSLSTSNLAEGTPEHHRRSTRRSTRLSLIPDIPYDIPRLEEASDADLSQYSGSGQWSGFWWASPCLILVNFLLMTVCFSLNHGAISTALALSSTTLGPTLGSYSLGIYYIMCTLSALTLSPILTQWTGPKWGIVASLFLHCTYVGSFLAASYYPDIKSNAIYAGAVVGGLGAGWLWTAQRVYFTTTVQLYATMKQQSLNAVTRSFSAMFAVIFLTVEALVKVLASSLYYQGGDSFVFAVLTVMGGVATMVIIIIRGTPQDPKKERGEDVRETTTTTTTPSLFHSIIIAVKLFFTNPKIYLVIPVLISSALAESFMIYFVNGTPTQHTVGGRNVPYMSAISAAVAAVCSIPLGYIIPVTGRLPIIVFGILCYTAMSISAMVMNEESLQNLGWGLCFMYVLAGGGRAVFEVITKHAVVDIFTSTDNEAAVANITLYYGVTSSLGCFIFPFLTQQHITTVITAVCVLAVITVSIVFHLHQRGGGRGGGGGGGAPNKYLINFLGMALCLSINHGTVTAVLAVASSNLGTKLAGYSSGTLYIFYTLSAMTISTGLVQWTGPKWGIVSSLFLMCAYVASFLIANLHPNVKWYAALFGSSIGGVAAGWLWTAQGAYFGRTAQRYAMDTKQEVTRATGYCAGLFAMIYVGFEIVFKNLFSFLRQRTGSSVVVFAVFTSAAILAAIAMLFIPEAPPEVINENGNNNNNNNNNNNDDDLLAISARLRPNPLRKTTSALRLLITDSKMALLTPMNMAFGFTAAFMNLFVNGTPTKLAIGEQNVGYMAAITPSVATILSMPYSYIAGRVGKLPVMMFGVSCYIAMAVSVWIQPEDHLQDLGWGICYLYILGGSGRAVFEGTNKATFADFFSHSKEAAFANLVLQSGAASAFAFFVFPSLGKVSIAVITAGVGILALLCLPLAFRKPHQQQTTTEPLLDPSANTDTED